MLNFRFAYLARLVFWAWTFTGPAYLQTVLPITVSEFSFAMPCGVYGGGQKKDHFGPFEFSLVGTFTYNLSFWGIERPQYLRAKEKYSREATVTFENVLEDN